MDDVTTVYKAQFLEDDKYYSMFQTFKNHVNDNGPELLVEAISKMNTKEKSLKWLSIGSGYGDAELKIIKKLSEKTTLTIDLLECYERGNYQFSHLSTIDFGKNVKNVQTLQEDFNANTQLLEESYDIITMFHVHYYWITANDRAEIMKKVFGSLKPEGILYILMLDKGSDNQIGLRRATKKKLKFENPRRYDSVTLYGSDVAIQEINPVASAFPNIEIIKPYPHVITLDIDLDQAFKLKSDSSQLLSFLLQVDFDQLPMEMQNFIWSWVEENFMHVKDKQYRMLQSCIGLMYKSVVPHK